MLADDEDLGEYCGSTRLDSANEKTGIPLERGQLEHGTEFANKVPRTGEDVPF